MTGPERAVTMLSFFRMFAGALRHRVAVTYKAEAKDITSDHIIKDILGTVEIP